MSITDWDTNKDLKKVPYHFTWNLFFHNQFINDKFKNLEECLIKHSSKF